MVTVSASKNDCKPCINRKTPDTGKKYVGVITGILLALLPKCPFCYMAFSGALMLCGTGGGMYTRTFFSSATLGITIIFCLFTLISVILNFRDTRTKYAILLVVSGSAAIIFSVTVTGGLLLYYSGVVIVFGGVWLNASLLYFVRKIKEYQKKKELNIS